MNSGVPLSLVDDQTLERRQWTISLPFTTAEQRVEHLARRLSAQRVEANLCVIGFAGPLVRILRSIVHQQFQVCCPNRISQQV